MKIAGTKKIIVEDFPVDARETAQRMAAVLNPHVEQVAQACNGSLTIRDNLKSKVYSITLPIGVSTYVCSWDLNEKPVAVLDNILVSTGAVPAAAVRCYWVYANGKLTLTFRGLDAALAHKATIVGIS